MGKMFFSFELLDQLPDLNDKDTISEIISNSTICRISPLVEYIHLEKSHSNILPSISKLLSTKEINLLSETDNNSMLVDKQGINQWQANLLEFSRIPSVSEDFESPAWIKFSKRLERACLNAGFSKQIAAGITGAFEEMVSNISEHSEHPETGLVGYRWTKNEIEYVVSDAGIGVLASLGKCRDYKHLLDSSDALQTAIRPGVSRFGKDSGRGTGFRTVFNSLLNLNGTLRFRSGEYSLQNNSNKFSLTATSKIRQCVHFQGFLISVVCRP